MTYNVFGGALSLTQSIIFAKEVMFYLAFVCLLAALCKNC